MDHRRGRGWLINEGVRRRVRPRHDIAEKSERQVCGVEEHWRQLGMLLRLRLGVCTGAKFSVGRLLKAAHVLPHSAERAPPALLGTRLGQVGNGPASRGWQA